MYDLQLAQGAARGIRHVAYSRPGYASSDRRRESVARVSRACDRWLLRATAAELAAALGDLLSDVDREVLTGEFGDFLAASTRAALASGPWGWFDDDLAFLRDWGFDLSRIERPVTIWHGQQDRFVPFSHGQ